MSFHKDRPSPWETCGQFRLANWVGGCQTRLIRVIRLDYALEPLDDLWLLGRQDVRPWCQTIPAPSHVPILKIIVGIIERREVRGNHKAAIAVMYLIRALYDIRRQKYLLAGDCRRAPKCVLTHIGKGHFPQEQIC